MVDAGSITITTSTIHESGILTQSDESLAKKGFHQAASEFADMAVRLKWQTAMLEGLHYRTMTNRRDTVKEKHAGTLNWVLNPLPGQEETEILQWLKNGKGLFWITGKVHRNWLVSFRLRWSYLPFD